MIFKRREPNEDKRPEFVERRGVTPASPPTQGLVRFYESQRNESLVVIEAYEQVMEHVEADPRAASRLAAERAWVDFCNLRIEIENDKQ